MSTLVRFALGDGIFDFFWGLWTLQRYSDTLGGPPSDHRLCWVMVFAGTRRHKQTTLHVCGKERWAKNRDDEQDDHGLRTFIRVNPTPGKRFAFTAWGRGAGNKIYYDSIYNWLMMTSGSRKTFIVAPVTRSCRCALRRGNMDHVQIICGGVAKTVKAGPVQPTLIGCFRGREWLSRRLTVWWPTNNDRLDVHRLGEAESSCCDNCWSSS